MPIQARPFVNKGLRLRAGSAPCAWQGAGVWGLFLPQGFTKAGRKPKNADKD